MQSSVKLYAHGGRSWIATIIGRDSKYGLSRQFLRRDDVTAARTNVYRMHEYLVPLTENAIYEHYRQATSNARSIERGFLIVRNGELHDISRADVMSMMEEMAA